MGHAKELITMDVYGDKRRIIADCVDELQPFIDEVMPDLDEDEMIATENLDVMISVEDYLIYREIIGYSYKKERMFLLVGYTFLLVHAIIFSDL